jgi:uncharacterized repeat protein (TIGR03943 family)
MSLDHVTPAPVAARVTQWSARRVAAGLVLAAWAGLFWWLIVTGRTPLYLSSRTDWVVPLGAVLLTLGSLGRLLYARAERPEPISSSSAWLSAAIVLPVVVVIALPPAALGSFAASRRSSLVSAGGFGSSRAEIASGDVTLFDVAGAFRSNDAMKALVARAGTEVSFVGFVNRTSDMAADEFLLTRFLISCCAADALSVQVRVVGAPPGKFARDDWVAVEGKLYPVGGEVLVDASDVTAVPRPKRPYLSA